MGLTTWTLPRRTSVCSRALDNQTDRQTTYCGESWTLALEFIHSIPPIHSTTVAYVSLRKSVATFWAYGSGFDSVDELDEVEDVDPPERLGFWGMVVCPGGVANAIWAWVERRSRARRVTRDKYVDLKSPRSSLLSILKTSRLSSQLLRTFISIASILRARFSMTTN